MRFHYDLSRAKCDAVTAIELGDFDRGYRWIDISGKDARLYSLTCPVMRAPILMAIPRLTNGLAFVPKSKTGQPLMSKVDALDLPGGHTAQLMLPSGTVDTSSVATVTANGARREIKEWQAILDHLRSLPVKSLGDLPVIPVDARAAEVARSSHETCRDGLPHPHGCRGRRRSSVSGIRTGTGSRGVHSGASVPADVAVHVS